jgi:hypothetical protein
MVPSPKFQSQECPSRGDPPANATIDSAAGLAVATANSADGADRSSCAGAFLVTADERKRATTTRAAKEKAARKVVVRRTEIDRGARSFVFMLAK